MGAAIRCEVGPDQFPVARDAAMWVRAFYPDIDVILDRAVAQLASDARSEGALRLIWQTSLINEKLLADGASQRAEVIEALVR